jgi:predicted nucleic acid-binding Zn ribbon protein
MHLITPPFQNSSEYRLLSPTGATGTGESIVKSHCWYCNKPLQSHRTYCSTECREAIFEDNEHAKERRQIFGCQC